MAYVFYIICLVFYIILVFRKVMVFYAGFRLIILSNFLQLVI